MKFLKVLTILTFVAFVGTVGLYNQKDIYLSIFDYSFKVPIWLVMAVFFLLGAIVSQIVCIIDALFYTKRIREYAREIKQLKEEVNVLRKLTVKSDD